MKILAVDDDESILELITEFLYAFGYSDVVTAASGAEALDNISVEKPPFDCILVDIQMPQMNGIELCRRLRSKAGYENVPILMLTAMHHKKYIDEAFEAGATDYVTKPFDFVELQNRLSDARKAFAEREQSKEESGSEGSFEATPAKDMYRLNEPILIPGLKGVLGYAEFDNYVLQMSRARLFNSTVQAVKIRKIERLFETCTASEFFDVISTAALAISECTQQNGNFVSYRGDGVFLVISPGKLRSSDHALEAVFNSHVRQIKPESLVDIELTFLVGESVKLRAITKSGAMFSLNIAIGNVEEKGGTEKTVSSTPKRVFQVIEQSFEQKTLEKKAYEVLLKDVMMEERWLNDLSQTKRVKSWEF